MCVCVCVCVCMYVCMPFVCFFLGVCLLCVCVNTDIDIGLQEDGNEKKNKEEGKREIVEPIFSTQKNRKQRERKTKN